MDVLIIRTLWRIPQALVVLGYFGVVLPVIPHKIDGSSMALWPRKGERSKEQSINLLLIGTVMEVGS